MKRFISSVFLSTALLIVPLVTSADTISDLQAQIQALLSRLADLQKQQSLTLSPVPVPGSDDFPTPTPTQRCPMLTITMQRGSRDATTRGQVSELQIWLANKYGLNDDDVVTGYFGAMTEKYVKLFQTENSLPVYGIVGSLTRSKIAAQCQGVHPTTPPISCANIKVPTFCFDGKVITGYDSCGGVICGQSNNKCGVNTFAVNGAQCGNGGYWGASYVCYDGTRGGIDVQDSCMSAEGLRVQAVNACAQRCTTSGITVTAPNGGERWEIGQLNTITWSPYSYNPGQNPATQVIAYLLRNEGGSWEKVGRILDQGKASLHTYFNLDNYQTWAKPGEYLVEVLNTVTGARDRSDASFTLLQKAVDLQVNGKDGGVVIPSGNTPLQLEWKLRPDVYACRLEGVNVLPLLSIAPPSGAVVGTLAFVPPSGAFTSVGMKCMGPGGSERSDYVSIQVSGPTTASSVQVISPNGGELIDVTKQMDITYRMTGLRTPLSIALYRNDQWFTWLNKEVFTDKSLNDIYSYSWVPDATMPIPLDFGAVWKIYITGQKADGTGYVDDKSDAPFSFVQGNAVAPRINFFGVHYDNESTNENRTKVSLGTQGMRQCDIVKGNRPGGSGSASQFALGQYTVLMPNVGVGGAHGSPESVIRINNPEPSMMLAARCLDANGAQYFSNVISAYKVFPNRDPVGYFDSITATTFSGWACDYNDYAMPLDIHFYLDGPAGTGTFLGSGKAYTEREKAVGDLCGNVTEHGFSIPVSTMSAAGQNRLTDGQPHTIYAYAINIPQGNNPLLGMLPTVPGAPPTSVRVDTTTITPSKRTLGTYDDFRASDGITMEASIDQICSIAGKGRGVRPLSYSCGAGNTESRHNGTWGYFDYNGTGWCETSGIAWVDCDGAPVARTTDSTSQLAAAYTALVSLLEKMAAALR